MGILEQVSLLVFISLIAGACWEVIRLETSVKEALHTLKEIELYQERIANSVEDIAGRPEAENTMPE